MGASDQYWRYLDHSAVKLLLRAATEGGPKPKPDAIFGAYLNVEQTVTPLPDICPPGVTFRLWSNVRLAVDKINRAFSRELDAHRLDRAQDRLPVASPEPAATAPSAKPAKQRKKKKRRKQRAPERNKPKNPAPSVQEAQNKQGVILVSRRGMRVDETRRCDECKMEEHPVWRYAKSNIGPAFLCSRCKPKVFDRSFGTIDVMNTRLIVVTAFESGTRRH